MGIVLWILCGLVAGTVAMRVMPGPNYGGTIVAISVGIVGGLLGGLLGTLWGGNALTALDPRSLLMAIIGTLFLLFSYRCLAMRAAL